MSARWRVLAQFPDFRRLFGGNTISLFGSRVTSVALPLTAVSYLGASPLQMGLLGAGALIPNLLFGLPAGVWLARLPYKRVVVVADVLQFVLLGTIPVLAAFGLLAIWQLYVIVILTGTCGLFHAVAAEAYTPMLVPQQSLLSANSVKAVSNSVVDTSGAAIGGALVQLLTAPVAIVVDAVSFLCSAAWKSRIGHPGRRPASGQPARESLPRQVLAGIGVVFDHPALRSITIAATIGAFAGQIQAVVLVLYLVRELHLADGIVGVVIAIAGLAGILGALAGTAITGRLGNGPTFILGMLVAGLAGIVHATAGGPLPIVLAVVALAQILGGSGPTLYGINQQTIRQTLVPADLLSRALATWRVLVYGVQPIGALVGGVLGEFVGFRGALITSSCLMLIGTFTAYASPLRTLRSLPDRADHTDRTDRTGRSQPDTETSPEAGPGPPPKAIDG